MTKPDIELGRDIPGAIQGADEHTVLADLQCATCVLARTLNDLLSA